MKDRAPIAKALRNDLDWITMRALEKDRARRYETANGLARDLQRYLDGEPVEAGAPTTTYRLKKFAWKHRGFLATASAMALLITVAAIVSTVQAIRARRAESAAVAAEGRVRSERDRARAAEHAAVLASDQAKAERDRAVVAEQRARLDRTAALVSKQRADREAQIAKAVSEFLQKDLLEQAGSRAQARPDVKPDPDIKVRTVLDRAAARIGQRFDDQPAVEASIWSTIAESYFDLGLYSEAGTHFARAYDLYVKAFGESDTATLLAGKRLGKHYLDVGRLDEAEKLLSLLQTAALRSGNAPPETVRELNSILGALYTRRGKYALAEPLLRSIVEAEQRIAPDALSPSGSDTSLARVYMMLGKHADAERLLLAHLRKLVKAFGPEHPDTVGITNNLAVLYTEMGRFASAQAMYRKVLEYRNRISGADHPNTVLASSNLGVSIFQLSQTLVDSQQQERLLAEAEGLLLSAYQRQLRLQGADHARTVATLFYMARVYLAQGRLGEAESTARKVIASRLQTSTPEHSETLFSQVLLDEVRLRQGKPPEAEESLRRLLSNIQKAGRPTLSAEAFRVLGLSVLARKEFAEAERYLLQAYSAGQSRVSTAILGCEALAALYEQWGKPAEAARWKAKAASHRAATQ